jgi:hypothetical protein
VAAGIIRGISAGTRFPIGPELLLLYRAEPTARSNSQMLTNTVIYCLDRLEIRPLSSHSTVVILYPSQWLT